MMVSIYFKKGVAAKIALMKPDNQSVSEFVNNLVDAHVHLGKNQKLIKTVREIYEIDVQQEKLKNRREELVAYVESLQKKAKKK